MKILQQAQATLCVYRHNNDIWFSVQDMRRTEYTRTSCSISEFVESVISDDIGQIYVIGSKENAQLITDIYTRYKDTKKIFIGSPMLIDSSITSPKEILRAMDLTQLPGSCGGWREVTKYDFINYKLIQLVNADTELLTDEIKHTLSQHPAYPAISFVSSHNLLVSAKLLVEIVDPRWFVDPINPDRTSRLRNYFGMQLDHVDSMVYHTGRSSRLRRAQLLYDAWSSGNLYSSLRYDPGNFLLRVVRDHAEKEKGVLKACIRYLSFIRHVWLDTVAPEGRVLFVPKYFFTDELEIYAYKAHAARIKAQMAA
jgi:hypothetical protein